MSSALRAARAQGADTEEAENDDGSGGVTTQIVARSPARAVTFLQMQVSSGRGARADRRWVS